MHDPGILAAELHAALLNREIYAVYQPQIDPVTLAVVGVEGLCRWNRPGTEIVAPDVFIPLAEETGVIHDVGRFMLEEGLAQIEHWRAQRHPIEVSVNVSPIQLTSDVFADHLISRLAALGMPGALLTIEITESLPVGDIEAIVPRLERLRAVGVGVSLDDYGAGHSSLGQLDALPLSEVKLDRSLMQSVEPRATRILHEAVERARELGLRVVAEGIETNAHLELARTLGCDRVQGFLFASPMSADAVDRLLAA